MCIRDRLIAVPKTCTSANDKVPFKLTLTVFPITFKLMVCSGLGISS